MLAGAVREGYGGSSNRRGADAQQAPRDCGHAVVGRYCCFETLEFRGELRNNWPQASMKYLQKITRADSL